MNTFADYMDRILYGAGGYYSSGTARSGKKGDYFTAPDVGPVFGQLLAAIFMAWELKLGSDGFTLIEAGAGEGRLAADILKVHPFRYIAIERSPSRRQALKNPETYSDLSHLKDLEGVLFANELIDAFPVHRVRMKNGKLEEAYVESRNVVWNPPSTPRLQAYFDRLGLTLPDGYETEVNLAMAGWLTDAAHALRKGLVVLIDFGRPAHDYYAPERTGGMLRAFSKHKVSADVMDLGAAADLTADVDFTSLALDAKGAGFTPLAFMEMGTFLLQGWETVTRNTERGTQNAGLKYLLHPEGLGTAFHVLILGKGIDPKDWVFEHNRLSRLGLEGRVLR